MPGYVYWLDCQNIYQGCNDQQAIALGLASRHDIIGKRNCDFARINRSVAKIWDKNNLEVIRRGRSKVVEEPSILVDGSTVMVLSHKVPLLDKHENVIGLLGVSLDISHWKKRESALKKKIEETDLPLEHIVSLLPGHVYWKDRAGVYLGCNDRQARTLGLSLATEVIGKTDFDLPWGQALAADYRKNDLRIMKTGNSEVVEEVANIQDQETIFLSQKTPLKDKQGKIVGILGISFDITEQKRLEKALIEAKETAESANQLKSEFIRNMEHDIRTPFSGILGMAKILDAIETDPVKKQMISDIAVCAQELLNYSCSILDFSKIEAGILPVLSKKFYLKDLIDSLLNIELPAAKTKGLEFSVSMAPDVPSCVIGDDYRLKRILINLLSNAIKFTHQGFVHLKVETSTAPVSKRVVLRFCVEDSGIGIAEDKLNMLYEKFSRLTPSNLGIYRGQGLGLRIVKQFIQEMEGEIEIESVLGQGSRFICTLPFQLSAF